MHLLGLGRCAFFFGKRIKSVTDQCTNLNTRTGQPNRSSRKTSCSDEMFTPVLGCGRLSRRDNAKALSALHARMLLHLLNQAALTLFCIRTGAVSALALARHLKNSAVSADQRPQSLQPVRQAALGLHPPPIPGCVASFVLRACFSATPRRRAAPRLVVPSRRKGDTISVSMANWAPWNKANPSAMTSILRPSNPLILAISKSRMKTFVVTLAPASLHTCAATHSRG